MCMGAKRKYRKGEPVNQQHCSRPPNKSGESDRIEGSARHTEESGEESQPLTLLRRGRKGVKPARALRRVPCGGEGRGARRRQPKPQTLTNPAPTRSCRRRGEEEPGRASATAAGRRRRRAESGRRDPVWRGARGAASPRGEGAD